MSALRNFSAIARRSTFNAQRFPQRSFQTFAARCSGKEDALNHDGRAEEVDMHKRDQLNKQKEGQGQWKDELASNSESIIKADRGEIDASADTIEQLQQETVKLMQKASKSEGDEAKAPKA